MPNLPDRLKPRIRWLIIVTQHYPVLRPVFLWANRLGTWRVTQLFRRTPGVRSVYIRHTHPRSSSFVPGHSDLDVTIVLTEEAAGDPDQVEGIANRVEVWNRIHYYLKPEDLRFTTRKELARVTRTYGSPYELSCQPDDWVLLAGEEVRTEQSRDFPAEKIPWHPEFNRWWQHLLQDHLLIQMPPDAQYLRIFYRGALKQQLYFLAASGKEITRPPGHLDDSLVDVAFRDNPELLRILSNLKRQYFWDKKAQYVKERIFWHMIRSAADFFRSYSTPLQTKPSETLPRDDWKLHKRAYEALESRLAQWPGLNRWMSGVLVYPVPYCYPYFYQVDFVVREGLPFEEFSEMVESVKKTFRTSRAREFYLGDQGYSIALVLQSIYESPLVFLGSPLPFLVEHILRYGKELLGFVTRGFQETLRPEALATWCRIFLPYYMFTLSYRIEHSSRTLNFSQLASIRLFLETGETQTDPLNLRDRHQAHFKAESPDDVVWDYMLKDKPGRSQQNLYRAASELLLQECRHVEALLKKAPQSNDG